MESNTLNEILPSKSAVRRAVNKIKTELSLIEEIVASLKEVYALNEIEDADTIIEALDKEVDEIMASFDEIIQERLDKGEEESVLHSNKSHVNDDKVSLASSNLRQKQLEAKQASECLAQVEEEQKQKELELERITAELQLAKQWAEEARKVAALNQQRENAAEQEAGLRNKDDISLGISRSPDLEYEKNAYGQYQGRLIQRS